MWDMAGMWDVEWQRADYWFLFVKCPSLSLRNTFSDSEWRTRCLSRRDVSLDEKSLSNEKLHELLQCCFSNQNGGRRNKKFLSVELSWKKRHLILVPEAFICLCETFESLIRGHSEGFWLCVKKGMCEGWTGVWDVEELCGNTIACCMSIDVNCII